jgi:hypothetical protein
MANANKRNHIFGNPAHNMGGLVSHFGNEAAAEAAIDAALRREHDAGNLVTDAYGIFEQTLNVDGFLVTVRGRIVAGAPLLGTAWV